MTVVIALIFYREQTNDMKTNLMKFRLSLVKALLVQRQTLQLEQKISKFTQQIQTICCPRTEIDKTSHMPKRGSSRMCGQCSTKKEPHRTNWFCET